MGPAGPKGDKGDAGPMGAIDGSQIYVKYKTGGLAINESVAVTCEAGDIVISGSCSQSSGSLVALASSPVGSVPIDAGSPTDPYTPGNGWSCLRYNTGNFVAQITAIAFCLDVTP